MFNPTNRHQELKAILDRLKLSGMAKHFPDLALRAAKEGLSHEASLHELARQEEAYAKRVVSASFYLLHPLLQRTMDAKKDHEAEST